jgi:hypothetical protein
MKKIIIVALILVVLTVGAFVRHYLATGGDSKLRLERLASKFSILISEGRGARQAVNLTGGHPSIMISRSWAEIGVDGGGYDYTGPMKMYVHVYSPDYEQDSLYGRVLETVNESAERAKWVFEHPDLRVRLLGLAAVRKYVSDSARVGRGFSAGFDKSRLLEALGVLVGDNDPFVG